MLVNVVQAMESGRAITVTPIPTRLTMLKAADLLGVSPPTLVKLLESGGSRTSGQVVTAACAWRTCSTTATVPARRGAALDELTREAVALGAYDSTADDYRDALASVHVVSAPRPPVDPVRKKWNTQ